MATADWCQFNITFPDQRIADRVLAEDLYPALCVAQTAGWLSGWWFMRKQPWKLRFLAHESGSVEAFGDLLTQLSSEGRIVRWTSGIYEPETTAFGGPEAMHVAHRLLHEDSGFLLAKSKTAEDPILGQRETAVLLFSTMLRGAGLDWYEQGDVWAKVTDLRPFTQGMLSPERAHVLASAVHRLMTADAHPQCVPNRKAPLVGLGGWVDAFEHAGQALADLAQTGQLRRGLRAVLAHHFLFHANRSGLTITDQSVLAMLATSAVFDVSRGSVFSLGAATTNHRVRKMTTLRDDSVSADELRHQLTDRLTDSGAIRTAAVETAFRTTPRHFFLPAVPLDQAYADNPVYTKQDGTGTSISAASQPWLVAAMLEQLAAQPGQRIMEAGAGTGYNAALMAGIVGEAGHVTTIDVDEDLVHGAREHLVGAGVSNVEVVLGDGALGHPDGAPYDRIIATVGAYDVPTAWLEQLAPGGRLVVPLRLRGTNSRSIIFERDHDGWRSRGSQLAVFMPLRGIGDDARRVVSLTPETDVTLQVHKDQTVDGHALDGVLDSVRHEVWTSVLFPPNVPYEWMELWLCLRLDNALMRMSVRDTAKVTPMFPWGSMCTVRGGDLAYLTTRPAPPVEDGGKMYEVGVIGHGPGGSDLAREVAEEIRTWDSQYRAQSVQFELLDHPVSSDPDNGRFVLDRPGHPITVTWS